MPKTRKRSRAAADTSKSPAPADTADDHANERSVKMPTKSTKRPTKATVDDANANTAVDPKEHMLSTITSAGYDGSHFATSLEISVEDKMKRGKTPKRNRYIHYCNWAHALLRKEIGPTEAEFSFPSPVLAYIRHLAPGDVKGEIREGAYQVTMKEFCEAMEMPETSQ